MAIWLYTSYSTIHTQTQMQTKSEAFKKHTFFEYLTFSINFSCVYKSTYNFGKNEKMALIFYPQIKNVRCMKCVNI